VLSASVPLELAGVRVDLALAKMFPQYSRNRLQAWLKTGHVLVGGDRAQASAKTIGGEKIELAPPAAADVAKPKAQRMALEVVFEDRELLVINKPAGLGPYLKLTDGTIEGCGILGGTTSSVSGQSRNLSADCGGWQQKWAANAARDRPQIAVVEIGAWEVFDLKLNGAELPFGSPAWDTYFDQQLTSGIRVLTAVGAQVALLSVPCYQPISAGGLRALPERGDTARTSHINTRLQTAAEADPQHVFLIASPHQFCDDPTVVGNTAYRWDGTHFYIPGAALEFKVITPELLAIPQPPPN